VWWTTMPNGLSGRPVFALPGASTSFILPREEIPQPNY